MEYRKYKSGWTLRIWRTLIRWNRQESYFEFGVSWIGPNYVQSGGQVRKFF